MKSRICRGTAANREARYVAPCDRRYVGMYYYSPYWMRWSKILDVKGNVWTVQAVELDANGEEVLAETLPQTHMTELDARCFADRPFFVLLHS